MSWPNKRDAPSPSQASGLGPSLSLEGRGKRKEPPWVVAFLRALARTGEARAAAEDAGIDHSTAYARRRAHAGFAAAWGEALAAHEEFVKRQEAEEIAAVRGAPSPSHGSAVGPSLSLEGRGAKGEELVASAGQVKRVGYGRWGKAKEKIFFDELAAHNNIHRAAKAAGVSYNAVLARRLKHPVFAAKWEAVAQTAKATINMHLLEETRKSFDPDELDIGEVTPRVTIDQAIKITQSGGAAKGRHEAAPNPFAEDAGESYEDQMEGVYDRLITKLKRMKERDEREKLEAGWTYDENFDLMIPPGYVQGPDYKPKGPEEPIDWDARYQ